MNGTQDKYDYSFKVLHEQISDSDLFEDQTHESVANTLFTLIETADKGITIGLEGSWGAGKSTVVHLLESKLRALADKKTLFFSFDAWAHDGDPLRKIFLESLIDQIDPEEKNEDFKQLKTKVSARTKKVEVTTKKKVSKLGAYISISAFLVPMGAALLSALNYEKLVAPWHPHAGSVSWPFFLGLLFVLMPLIVMACWGLTSKFFIKTLTWDFFESDSVESYTQDITEDGERTSIEFERFFAEIMTNILAEGSNCDRCVIVIDNLDRVDPEYAQNIWSTLQTFFQHRGQPKHNDKEQWRDKLWFIVPFDRDGLCKTWSNSSDITKSENELLPTAAIKATNPKDVARSFFEKCFQVIAEVPPAVMSAWVSYFEQAARKSLTGWPEDAISEFIQTYVRCLSNLETSPTPREMHSVINKAGITALEFKEQFYPEAVCIYAILRSSHGESHIRRELLNSNVPRNFPHLLPAQDIKAHLAGLLFKVSPAKGIQLLLAPEIKGALYQGDGEKLAKLESTHGEAFWVAWQASKAEWQVVDSHIDDYRIKFTHGLYTAFHNKKSRIEADIINLVNVWKASFDHWRFDEYSFVEPLKEVLSLTSDENDVLNWLNEQLQTKLKRVVNLIDSKDFPENELWCLAELDNFMEGKDATLKKFSYSKLELEGWTKWQQCLNDYEIAIPSVLPAKGVIQELAQLAFQGATTDKTKLSGLISTYSVFPKSAEWITAANTIIGWLSQPNREFDVEVVYSFVLKLLSESDKKIQDKIKACINSAAFWARSNQAPLTSNPSLPILAALCVQDLNDQSFITQAIKNYWIDKNTVFEADNVAQLFISTNAVEYLWELAAIPEYTKAKEVLCKSHDLRLFNNEHAVINLDRVFDEDDPELPRVTLAICKTGALKDHEPAILNNVSAYNKVIFYIYKHGDKSGKKFVIDILNDLSAESWLTAIQENSWLLQCVDKKYRAFSKAFSDFVSNCFDDSNFSKYHWVWEDFSQYCSGLMDASRRVFPDITKAYFAENSDPFDEKVFKAFAPHMTDAVPKIEILDLQKRIIFWLENNMFERLSWLMVLDFDTKESPLEELVSIVNDLSKADGANSVLYKEIAMKFKFPVEHVVKDMIETGT